MAYLVVDRHGRRQFRWLEGRRRSRRIPRGEAGDRLQAQLQAAQEARADALRAGRAEAAAAVAEADAVCREVAALDTTVRARLNGMLGPTLAYDPVHGTIVRADRMSTEKVKAAGGAGGRRKGASWSREGQAESIDPTFALRVRLAERLANGDVVMQLAILRNLEDIEAELLDGDDSPAARLLVGNLVLTWVHGLWADHELVWETHRVGVVPAATVAMTRRAESLARRFQGALRLWESYCLRTRGETSAFPGPAAGRIRGYFAGAN
jgi:hypothetical protein